MTARELILKLQQLDPEARVVVRGYEDGYNDIETLKPVKIKVNKNGAWYYGEFEESNDTDAIDAIDIYGENKKYLREDF
ncbi:MAG TPA: hypothetical protein VN722_03700 [Hanamia sp.]|nr:hypothetical protein [Hanamia sp.]